jgi:uncharacterized delta-60 repeat protein
MRPAARVAWLAVTGSMALALTAGPALAAPVGIDRSFGDNGVVTVDVGDFDEASALVAQPDGKVVVAGETSRNDDGLVFRLNRDGALDPTFDRDGIRLVDSGGDENLYGVARRADGKLVVGGLTSVGHDGAVYRMGAGGLPDKGFDGDGALGLDSGGYEHVYGVALAPGGKVVAAGDSTVGDDAVVYRINATGQLDKSFDGDGAVGIDSGGIEYAAAVAVQPDGKVVVVGGTNVNNDAVVYRLNENGSPDKSFDGDGKLGIDRGGVDYATDVAIQADGKIIVGGFSSDGSNGFVTRLNENGSTDRRFADDGFAQIDEGALEAVDALTIQPDGKILGGGYTNSTSDALVFRLNKDGSPDTAFAPDGIFVIKGTGLPAVTDIVRQPDGKIVVTGTTSLDEDALVVRLAGGTEGTGKPRPTVKGLRCEGLRATIAGTPKGDRISGTRGRDVIVARGGADRVSALGAGDVVCGGPGDDMIRGGAGRDVLRGGPGRDTLIGGPGKDRLIGGPGLDEVRQ